MSSAFLDSTNPMSLEFMEALYSQYLRDPASVPPDWRDYFQELQRHQSNGNSGSVARPSFKPRSIFDSHADNTDGHSGFSTESQKVAQRQDRVDQMVRAYRVRGHMIAKVNPLDLPLEKQPELELESYGFSEADLDQPCSSRTIFGADVRTLREIWQRLRNTYCRSIGVQFMHIDDIQTRHWLQERMEGTENRIELTRDEQIRILKRLTDAVVFEEFIQKKYVGAKSFSLEGSESLIPLLDLAIEKAGSQGIEEIVIGMAHRGRLNVLANIMGKRPQDIFREFDDKDPGLHLGANDVKYHLGYSSDWETSDGREIHLSLCFNPSHLEFINPVALGRMRAKQDRADDTDRRRGMVLLIHGDAAFAGEGITQETLNLSELAGYRIGGTIHVIVNNQIGFTTSPEQGRSSLYASAVAKMLQIPIFHVNGEDPEAVAAVIRLAMDFRAEFQRDVVIDMFGYRLQGHNESDEPSFTQPILYEAVRKRSGVRDGYLEHLLKPGDVTRELADKIETESRDRLEHGLSVARSADYRPSADQFAGIWSAFVGGPEKNAESPDTGVSRETLIEIIKAQTQFPDDFHLHPKLKRMIDARLEMADGKKPIDWTNAEALAFGSLALDGFRIRLSGQDSERGTFSQRHAVLHDVQTGKTFVPLQHLGVNQGPVDFINSPLSEAGVLGFEYGYSLDWPEGLILWEAQFGDFVNAAQVIIDQFIISAEDKWRRLSGIGLLLPHGFEGQGPEHSSARLERFLTLAAEDNIQVTYPTTPAQYFHLFRRQVMRPWRKPLVIMTPKSLLRSPKVASSLDELASGRFQNIIPDRMVKPQSVRRVLLCSGKVYYDLIEKREALKRGDVAIIRVEQLYPLPRNELQEALKQLRPGTQVLWVQEEPENMGAWRYMFANVGVSLFDQFPFSGVYREESASPATGWSSVHKMEQQQLLDQAFAD